MTLFQEGPDGPAIIAFERPKKASIRRRIGFWCLYVGIAIGLTLAVLPAPYVIETPGPVFNTLGTSKIEKNDVPLITVPADKAESFAGELNLLTVSVYGTRDSRPSWPNVLGSFFDPKRTVVPFEVIYPDDIPAAEAKKEDIVAMMSSQQMAIAAALTELGYPITGTVVVAQVANDGAANGILRAKDEVLSVDGRPIKSVADIRAALAAGSGASTFTIKRNGESMNVMITPTVKDGKPVVGIAANVTDLQFPIDVKLQLDDVGGPSAGMMFALGIIDKLTPGDLTGGQHIAGTGTIDEAGNVGPIGGIRQKMWAAHDEGSKWFLAPAENCKSVIGNIPAGLEVFAVKTLAEARALVEDISDGSVDSSPARCEASGN